MLVLQCNATVQINDATVAVLCCRSNKRCYCCSVMLPFK